MREYTQRARATLVDTSTKDSESDSEPEPEPQRMPAPEPEPEPETVARGVSWKLPGPPSGWAVGFDSMDAAARLYKTTTRPEAKVNVLHERHLEIPKEVLTQALQQSGGDTDAASALVDEWAVTNPDWKDWKGQMQLGVDGAAGPEAVPRGRQQRKSTAVPEAVPHDTASPVAKGAASHAEVRVHSPIPTEPEPQRTRPVERSHDVAKLRKERSALAEMAIVA